MALAAGTRLGPYEIVGLLGAGGMGEVYHAHDTRIGRDVAVKVLPAAVSGDADRLHRFEQEARAAGHLNHPNVVVLHDLGTHDGAPYLVMELLEGETLRGRLSRGGLPWRTAANLAVQMARGLSAAHERGIVHRDLKPENVFLTRDGHVKILDFGLAKLRPALDDAALEGPTASEITGAGAVLGTVGYMAPEQVKGQRADARSDIFSLGCVLYEMVSGRRAFTKETTAETMTAILKEDPAELAGAGSLVPPILERVVGHCLEKRPEDRFQSARDLAFALEALSDSRASGIGAATVAPARRGKPVVAGALVLAGLALAAGSYLAGSRIEKPIPSFQRLTFRRGIIGEARFAPDGKTIVYSAEWDGTRPEVFTTRPESPESRALGLPDYQLWAVSSTGELALRQTKRGGVLALVSLGGGAPRAFLEDVFTGADWSPDGRRLAIVRDPDTLEFPPGNTLYQSKRVISFLRVSATGDRLAFIESNYSSYDASVVVVDLQGKPIVTTRRWKVAGGLAWAPKGDEVWFSASEVGEALTLHAVDLSGRVRQVAGIPGRVVLKDISRDGRLLLTRETVWTQIAGIFPGSTLERDLSWLDAPGVGDISADGQTLLFTETGEGGGKTSLVYLRKTDGSPAVRLGEGTALSLSPDGKWAAARPPNAEGPQVVLLPTGAGQAKQFSMDPLAEGGGVSWFPDSKRFVVCGTEPGRKPRCYVVDVETGKTRPLTPEGVRGLGLPSGGNAPVSPDGRSLLVWDTRDATLGPVPVAVYLIEAGELQPLRGWTQGRSPRWSADGRAILLFRVEWPDATWLERFDLAKGVREQLKKLTVADRVGFLNPPIPVFTPDGRYYAYEQSRQVSDLYLVDGLR